MAFYLTKLYVIYSSTTLPLIQNSENVIAIISGENFYIDKRKINANHYYMITAVDRLQNESEPSEIVSTSGKPVEDVKPITQTQPRNDLITIAIKLFASPKLNNALTFRWEDKDFSSANEYFLEKSLNNKDFVLVAKFNAKAEVMFYDVYQLLESCYFRLKRIGKNGKTIYTNVITYHVQEPPISKKVAEDSKIVKNEVSGNFGEEDAKDLANILKSGKNDTSLNIIIEETVGIKTETPAKPITVKPENTKAPDSVSQPKSLYPPASPNLNKIGTVASKYLVNNSISILINTVGLIEYTLFKKSGEKVTWGKIQSNSSRSKVSVPGTNNLEAGEYRLELKKLTEKEASTLVIE